MKPIPCIAGSAGVGRATHRSIWMLSLATWAGTVLAEPPPDSGSILQHMPSPKVAPAAPRPLMREPQPAAQPEDGERFALATVELQNNKGWISAQMLEQATGPLPRAVSLGELQQIAARITLQLHKQGLFLARAFIPKQDVVDGKVRVEILEGRLEAVDLRNQSQVRNNVLRAFTGNLELGSALIEAEVTRSMLLMRELPGVQVEGVLRPGVAPGSTVLAIEAADENRFSAVATLDNAGSRNTGAIRTGVLLQYAGLAGLGDSASLQASASSGVELAQFTWRAPLDGQGLRLEASATSMQYRLGGSFAALHYTGSAAAWSLQLGRALGRSLSSRSDVALGLTQRDLKDVTDVGGAASERSLRLLGLSLSGTHDETPFIGGMSSGSMAATWGHLGLDQASHATDQGAGGSATAGGFFKLNLTGSHLRQLPWQTQLLWTAAVQWPSKNLTSSEKMTLGGPQAVRAFALGEGSGDGGWLTQLEWGWAPPVGNTRLFSFIDAGRVRTQYRPTTDGVNHQTLAGYGLGVGWTSPIGAHLKLSWAKRRHGEPKTEDASAQRLWAEASVQF